MYATAPRAQRKVPRPHPPAQRARAAKTAFLAGLTILAVVGSTALAFHDIAPGEFASVARKVSNTASQLAAAAGAGFSWLDDLASDLYFAICPHISNCEKSLELGNIPQNVKQPPTSKPYSYQATTSPNVQHQGGPATAGSQRAFPCDRRAYPRNPNTGRERRLRRRPHRGARRIRRAPVRCVGGCKRNLLPQRVAIQRWRLYRVDRFLNHHTRQGEKLVELREASVWYEKVEGFVLKVLVDKCYLSRFDLNESDAQFFERVKFCRRDASRILHCARQLGDAR